MGFLKFLKKGKKEEMLDESLDMPPPPPSIKEELPELPKFEEEKALPEEFPPFKFKFKEEKPISAEEKFPGLPKDFGLEIPSFPPLEEKPRFLPKPPVREVPLPKKELIKLEPEESISEEIGKIVRKERKPIGKGPVYVKLNEFKKILKGVNVIRGDLKKSDKLLYNLIKSREEKDRDFEKWNNIMRDIQKKLIFIEKTLFKK